MVAGYAVAPDPAPAAATTTSSPAKADEQQQRATVLTVWRKSLLPSCSGFTVFDAAGALAFRVDCYAAPAYRRGRTDGVVLMDVAGAPLLTLRRRSTLGLAERWLIYDGECRRGGNKATKAKPFLSVRRHVGLGSSSPLAHVTPLQPAAGGEAFVVEGSYARRACAVRDARGHAVAEVCRSREEHIGDDVFRLVAGPRLGAPLAMGLVIALDEMFGGVGRCLSVNAVQRLYCYCTD